MKTLRNAAGAAALLFVLGACGQQAAPTMPMNEIRPSYDGGFGMGSGNRGAPADSSMAPASNSGTDTTERGGFGMGSGN